MRRVKGDCCLAARSLRPERCGRRRGYRRRRRGESSAAPEETVERKAGTSLWLGFLFFSLDSGNLWVL